jgi:two-component system sensor histidine kinase RegB
LIENAADFAHSQVRISAHYDAKTVAIWIVDDGPGFDPDIIERLGEPYTSQRASSEKSGMGLGYFIAKTLLERSGARLTITNQKAPDHELERKYLGAEVRLRWPRAALELE